MSRTLEHFNYLHQIPELGFEEHKTSAYIGDALEAAGFQVQRNVGGTTGIVALLDSGKPGPVVALRADMDALGHIIDGRLEARHTCGHDGHSSVVLTAAEEILAEGLVKRGKLKILFQPAEELGTGAIALTDAASSSRLTTRAGPFAGSCPSCRGVRVDCPSTSCAVTGPQRTGSTSTWSPTSSKPRRRWASGVSRSTSRFSATSSPMPMRLVPVP